MSAIISEDGLYRYRLDRSLRFGGLSQVTWIMLNPSTADAKVDDPTIRRCVDFSKRWGFGLMTVVNLYALRATSPTDLRDSMEAGIDPVGPLNFAHVEKAMREATQVIVAWGAHPMAHGPHRMILPMARADLWCLGKTTKGHPRHPLYLPSVTVREKWGFA